MIDVKELSVGVDHDTRGLFDDYKSFSGASEMQQRTFTNWVKRYALCKGWEYKAKQSNGVSYFRFSA